MQLGMFMNRMSCVVTLSVLGVPGSPVFIHQSITVIHQLFTLFIFNGQGCKKACLMPKVGNYVQVCLGEACHPWILPAVFFPRPVAPPITPDFLFWFTFWVGSSWPEGSAPPGEEHLFYPSLETLVAGLFFQAVVEAG